MSKRGKAEGIFVYKLKTFFYGRYCTICDRLFQLQTKIKIFFFLRIFPIFDISGSWGYLYLKTKLRAFFLRSSFFWGTLLLKTTKGEKSFFLQIKHLLVKYRSLVLSSKLMYKPILVCSFFLSANFLVFIKRDLAANSKIFILPSNNKS